MPLRYIAIISITLSHFALASDLSRTAIDSLTNSPPDTVQRTQIMVDYAFLRGASSEYGWHPYLGLRFGYAIELNRRLMLCARADYSRFDLSSEGWIYHWSSPNAQRQDISLTLGVLLGHFIEIAYGISYTTSDRVSLVAPYDTYPYSAWRGSGSPAIKPCFSFGVFYEVPVLSGIYLPVGLYYRTWYNSSIGMPITLRAGIGKTF